MYARTRTREKGGLQVFSHSIFQTSPLPFAISRKNDTSVSTKQHVGFNKTTRRFQQNNTSFSTKQHVVFNKTTRRFQQNNVSFLGRNAVIDKGVRRKNQRRRRRFSFIRCVKSCK